MLNFKSFRSAGNVLAGVELMHMIRKRQFAIDGADTMSFADQFYAPAEQARRHHVLTCQTSSDVD